MQFQAARFLLAAIGVVLCLALGAGGASAHAEFRDSTPATGSIVDALPETVTLTFSEEVGVLALDWRMPDGQETAVKGELVGVSLTVAPPPDAGRGTYVLKWRVASADGHPVGGALVFSVGAVSITDAGGPASTAWPAVIARAAMVTLLVLAVGAALFDRLVQPLAAASARLARLATGFVAPLGILLIAAEGADRLGFAAGDLVSATALSAGFRTPVFNTVLLAALSALVAFVALRTGSRSAALAAWAIAALSFIVSGHALSAPTPIALPLTFIHAAAMLFWVGSLVPLAFAMSEPTSARAEVLRRFSRLALPGVIFLIGSGAGLILIREPGFETLGSSWAKLLGLKLALVATMLALALWHRQVARPRLSAGAPVKAARSVSIEAALGVCVLVLAMGFRLAPPPATEVPQPASIHIHGAKAMATITADRMPPGEVVFDLQILDGAFDPYDPLEITMTLNDPATGIGPLEALVERLGPGEWRSSPVTLPTTGPWDMKVSLLISDFEWANLNGRWPEPAP